MKHIHVVICFSLAVNSWSQNVKDLEPSDHRNIWELSGKFEGDILRNTDHENGDFHPAERWLDGIVPYIIQKQFGKQDISKILQAMRLLQSKSCITFRQYRKSDDSWINIGKEKSGCSSFVGSIGGDQVVNLGAGCMGLGTIIHELLHALGFGHQHNAYNRDDYVIIHWNNIHKGNYNNFLKNPYKIDFDVGYDYGSVMHYTAYAFSRDKKALPTITSKDKNAKFGQREGPSRKDLLKLNRMYKCFWHFWWKYAKENFNNRK